MSTFGDVKLWTLYVLELGSEFPDHIFLIPRNAFFLLLQRQLRVLFPLCQFFFWLIAIAVLPFLAESASCRSAPETWTIILFWYWIDLPFPRREEIKMINEQENQIHALVRIRPQILLSSCYLAGGWRECIWTLYNFPLLGRIGFAPLSIKKTQKITILLESKCIGMSRWLEILTELQVCIL